jgi:hypothetical protein
VARRRRSAGDPPALEADDSIPLDAEATALAWTPAGSLLAVGDRSGAVNFHRVG